MDEMIYYNNARNMVATFFEEEFASFPPLILSNFLNRFNDFLNYSEEGRFIRPNMIFTNNVEAVSRAIPKSSVLTIFEDKDATQFSSRLKSVIAIAERNWLIFIEIQEQKISYGLILAFGSIKDKRAVASLINNTSLKEKHKINCILVRPLNFYTMALNSISGKSLRVNFSLDTTKVTTFDTEVKEFVDVAFSKLRTTQRKLQDMKTMYRNIFTNVMNDVNGSICVIVDKDYVDTGLFSDGIWLKEPISFSKLFTQSKSYSEEKLQAYANLFINMLNFDGITIIDNKGQIRAYNVFVEPNSKRVGYIVGGARKRAAYFILSSKKKGIIGVYFQSHEGEVFFQEIVRANANGKNKKVPPQKEAEKPHLQPVDPKEKVVKPETNPTTSETPTPDKKMTVEETLTKNQINMFSNIEGNIKANKTETKNISQDENDKINNLTKAESLQNTNQNENNTITETNNIEDNQANNLTKNKSEI